ncbi:MAG: hypothetical protein C4320_03050 [Armatimonadota bacterium]
MQRQKNRFSVLTSLALLVSLGPAIGSASGNFASYKTEFVSFPSTPRVPPQEEARRYVDSEVDRGKMPLAKAKDAIAFMAASLEQSHGKIVLTGTTVGGQKDGLIYYSTFLPKSSPNGVEPYPAWEMLRDDITYQYSSSQSLSLSAGDDLRLLGSATMRWIFTGVTPVTTPLIQPREGGRSVHQARTRELFAPEKAQGLRPLVERIEINWQGGHPRRIFGYRGYGRASLRFRIEVREWKGDRPANFTVEEMDGKTKVLERRSHALQSITEKIPKTLETLGPEASVLDYRLTPEHPYGYAWVGHIMPIDLLRHQVAERDGATAQKRQTDWRPFMMIGVGGFLVMVGILLRQGRRRA